MTNEIKEILEDFKSMSEGTITPYELTDKDCKLLLDYITNLQDQVKGIREERNYLFNKLSTENKYLQEENERLKTIINKIKKMRNADTHVENIYYAEGVLLNEPYCDIEDIDNEELLNIIRGDE